jgi:DNA mismatch repair protein MutL
VTGSAPASSPRAPIRRLDADVVERIAAGEVVERPASVVKELVENALDAGARRIAVRIEGGGIERIEVSDDGDGIPAAELPLALERHATSKIPAAGPVEQIASLGFRGEALAAIAAVARVTIISRPPDDEHASGIRCEGGVTDPVFVDARAPGTTVEVRSLFFRTPARRKFLKTPAAEQLEVARAVEQLYLARPDVALALDSEGRELARYPPSERLADAAARVLGPSFLTASFPVDAPVPGGRMHAVLGRPSLAAPTSRRLYFAVNGRAVEARALAPAVRLAFGEFLPRTRYPIGVVHLTLDLDRLDVNVHPTKRTIRLAGERELADALRRTVREALLDAPQVAVLPGERPGRSAAGGLDPPAGFSGPAPAGVSASRQRTLEGSGPASSPRAVPGRRGHPELALLGCLDRLYWVATSDEGLVLVDQHAASERVVYETLRAGSVLARQTLVEPLTVRLTGAQRAALDAHAEPVRAAGFEIEAFGPEDVRVRAVPSHRGRAPGPDAVPRLLDELAEGGRPTVPGDSVDRTTATLACHAAIRAGDAVSAEELARVLRALFALPDAAYACPHGRPIVVQIPRGRLDRWFLRSGA